MKLLIKRFVIIALLLIPSTGYCGTLLIGAGQSSGTAADPGAPELLSATINGAGNAISLQFNENANIGVGGNGGWTIDMDGDSGEGMSYSSGDGTSNLIYSITGRAIDPGETGTIDYTQPGDGIEDDGGTDLANISDFAVTNNASGDCPSYYADAILSWDGDHSSGVLVACDSSATEEAFTDDGSDISTYGEDNSNAMKCDDSGEDAYLTQSAGEFFDPTASQTLCMKVKITAELDNYTNIWVARDADWSDYIYLGEDSSNDFVGSFTTTSSADYAGGAPVNFNSWLIIGYSWEGASIPTGDHSVNPGDQGTWADGWEDDAGELNHDMTDQPTLIYFGSVTADPGNTEVIYIDEWALFSGYKVNCSDYLQ